MSKAFNWDSLLRVIEAKFFEGGVSQEMRMRGARGSCMHAGFERGRFDKGKCLWIFSIRFIG